LFAKQIIGIALLMHGCAPAAGAATTPFPDARTQERVAELIQEAFAPSRTLPGAKATNAAWENSLRVEANFREASRLMPERLDLRFGIATALVGQAAQTNSPLLDVKIKQALDIYLEIWSLDTNGFYAGILYAGYARAIGETNTANEMIASLTATAPKRAQEYADRFERVDAFLEIAPNETLSRSGLQGKQHAVVVLGAALETNGVIKPKLVGRLRQALKLARAYPEAPIILTGGNQKAGITESYAMKLWLRRHGIAEKRIYLEDLARDTVGNALYSAAILQRLKASDVTIVTSLTHMRRGLADLSEACLQRGLNLHFANLAIRTEELALDPIAERIATYRDVMRISGLWAYPGISR
jgi:uncharacterized SAM-binding protein YcdF (DUF218 family)